MKPEEKLDLVMTELVTTEKAYVEDLEFVINNYMIPAAEAKIPNFPKSQWDIVFGNIEEVHFMASCFLDSIQEWYPDVGPCFTEMANGFEVYITYCTSFGAADQLLANACKTNVDLQKWLMEQQKVTGKGMNLSSYLIKPVQRLLKYPLLIREMLKYAPEDYRGRQELQDASKVIQDLASRINEVQREKDQVVELVKNIVDFPMTPTIADQLGPLVLESDAVENPGESRRHMKERHVFLFERQLVVCKHVSSHFGGEQKQFQYRYSFPLSSITVSDVDIAPNTIEIRSKDVKQTQASNNKVRSPLLLRFPTEELERTWLNTLMVKVLRFAFGGPTGNRLSFGGGSNRSSYAGSSGPGTPIGDQQVPDFAGSRASTESSSVQGDTEMARDEEAYFKDFQEWVHDATEEELAEEQVARQQRKEQEERERVELAESLAGWQAKYDADGDDESRDMVTSLQEQLTAADEALDLLNWDLEVIRLRLEDWADAKEEGSMPMDLDDQSVPMDQGEPPSIPVPQPARPATPPRSPPRSPPPTSPKFDATQPPFHPSSPPSVPSAHVPDSEPQPMEQDVDKTEQPQRATTPPPPPTHEELPPAPPVETHEEEEEGEEIPPPPPPPPEPMDEDLPPPPPLPPVPAETEEGEGETLPPPPTSTPPPPTEMEEEKVVTERVEEVVLEPVGEGVVLYDFVAEQDGELSVYEGNQVQVLQLHDQSGDPGWYVVNLEYSDGTVGTGIVPSSYVQMEAQATAGAEQQEHAVYTESFDAPGTPVPVKPAEPAFTMTPELEALMKKKESQVKVLVGMQKLYETYVSQPAFSTPEAMAQHKAMMGDQQKKIDAIDREIEAAKAQSATKKASPPPSPPSSPGAAKQQAEEEAERKRAEAAAKEERERKLKEARVEKEKKEMEAKLEKERKEKEAREAKEKKEREGKEAAIRAEQVAKEAMEREKEARRIAKMEEEERLKKERLEMARKRKEEEERLREARAKKHKEFLARQEEQQRKVREAKRKALIRQGEEEARLKHEQDMRQAGRMESQVQALTGFERKSRRLLEEQMGARLGQLQAGVRDATNKGESKLAQHLGLQRIEVRKAPPLPPRTFSGRRISSLPPRTNPALAKDQAKRGTIVPGGRTPSITPTHGATATHAPVSPQPSLSPRPSTASVGASRPLSTTSQGNAAAPPALPSRTHAYKRDSSSSGGLSAPPVGRTTSTLTPSPTSSSTSPTPQNTVAARTMSAAVPPVSRTASSSPLPTTTTTTTTTTTHVQGTGAVTASQSASANLPGASAAAAAAAKPVLPPRRSKMH